MKKNVSKFNESTMRQILGAYLEQYGALTIAEAKEEFNAIFEDKFSSYDKEILPSSATTPRFEKILGNIVSHQVEPVKRYKEGFICDKTCRPAVFANSNMTLTAFARKRHPHRLKRED